MAQTLKFGNKTWATKVGSTLAYNDENGNYKPLPFAFTRSTSATRVNKEGLIEVVTNDRPRIDYTDTSDGVLLLENAATNLVTYSEDFSNSSWIKNNVNLTNGFISPNGTANAYKITEDLTNNVHRIRISSLANGSAANKQFTYSTFVKKSEVKWFLLKTVINTQSVTIDVWFDLENGVIGTESNGTGKIENYGNDWYRCSINIVTNSSASSLNVYAYLAESNNSETYQGDGTSGLYIWGAMLEENSVASSYIPTQGSASTRVAETASGSGNSEVFNDSEGVLFVDIDALANDGTYRSFSLSDGSTDNELLVYYYGNNILAADFRVGAVNQAPLTANINQLINNKISFSYKVNNFKLYVNGFLIATDTSGSVPTINTFNNLSISRANGSLPFYGKTKEIGYYDAILTDLELEYLTSYRSWTSMVNELNLNIIYNG